jgi:hypothetical protein
MTAQGATQAVQANERPRQLGKSAVALLVGFVVGVAITLATDFALHLAGVFPPLGQPTGSKPLLFATVYRTVYQVLSSYITARLAPDRPMGHALVGGAIGFVICTLGAVVTWNKGPAFGPHWYPIALIVLAMPTAWLGGRLRTMQMQDLQKFHS